MLMKDFISYELAKKLENKGFDCDNNYGYNDKGNKIEGEYVTLVKKEYDNIDRK